MFVLCLLVLSFYYNIGNDFDSWVTLFNVITFPWWDSECLSIFLQCIQIRCGRLIATFLTILSSPYTLNYDFAAPPIKRWPSWIWADPWRLWSVEIGRSNSIPVLSQGLRKPWVVPCSFLKFYHQYLITSRVGWQSIRDHTEHSLVVPAEAIADQPTASWLANIWENLAQVRENLAKIYLMQN